MVMMVGAFGQLSGNGMITYFLPVLLANAGITDQNKKLTLNFVNSVTSYAGALFGSWSVDRLGRRRQLLIGTGLCAILLFICTGLLSKTGDSVRSNAGISLIYLFMVIFSFGWTAMSVLVLLPKHLTDLRTVKRCIRWRFSASKFAPRASPGSMSAHKARLASIPSGQFTSHNFLQVSMD
jgi:MFS family permease